MRKLRSSRFTSQDALANYILKRLDGSRLNASVTRVTVGGQVVKGT